MFDGIEIKLNIKEHRTGYGLHLVDIQKTQRDVIRPPNHLLSSAFLLPAAAKDLLGSLLFITAARR